MSRYTFGVYQLCTHCGINAGQWFIGAPYKDRGAYAQKTVPRSGGPARVFWTLDGRILDEYEIAQGFGNRYPTIDLFDSSVDQAFAALDRAKNRAVRALRKHEAQCVTCSNPGLQEQCATRTPLANVAADF